MTEKFRRKDFKIKFIGTLERTAAYGIIDLPLTDRLYRYKKEEQHGSGSSANKKRLLLHGAVSIAVATNLLRRQDLTIIERGKAYKAVLDAEKRQGARTDIGTSGENRQKFLTREIVADFFGVTEYEIRKAIKLAGLIEPLADILEDTPRKLPIACAELIADYDATTHDCLREQWTQYLGMFS